MSCFAQLDENDIVVNIIVVQKTDIESGRFGNPDLWVETDPHTIYNVHYDENFQTDNGTPFRGNYACIGQKYDRINDVFYPPKIFPSWVMNETNWSWQAPIPKPSSTDTIDYVWNESTLSWVQITIT
jgi:hypothetical protein